ncbi:MAG: hypothetical protein HC767_06295 [Akkermansiaceae bacterium]|nr:hypothetical protein [Akkermansiaceae bacterium]
MNQQALGCAACGRQWEQCGGLAFAGGKCCIPGLTCNKKNDYYHQCECVPISLFWGCQ